MENHNNRQDMTIYIFLETNEKETKYPKNGKRKCSFDDDERATNLVYCCVFETQSTTFVDKLLYLLIEKIDINSDTI